MNSDELRGEAACMQGEPCQPDESDDFMMGYGYQYQREANIDAMTGGQYE